MHVEERSDSLRPPVSAIVYTNMAYTCVRCSRMWITTGWVQPLDCCSSWQFRSVTRLLIYMYMYTYTCTCMHTQLSWYLLYSWVLCFVSLALWSCLEGHPISPQHPSLSDDLQGGEMSIWKDMYMCVYTTQLLLVYTACTCMYNHPPAFCGQDQSIFSFPKFVLWVPNK